MKKSTLISFWILGTLINSTTSIAANLNPRGAGQALIYPYYTVNNDLNTLVSVVNPTSDVKALKVRFLESDNGQPVLDFNAYVGPFDVWTAALSATATGAQLSTADNSCVPFLGNPQPFLDFAFVLDPGSDAEEREREGYLEIIEMAVVTDAVLTPSATHVNGVPANCGTLAAAWLPGGQWFIDPTDGVEAASGGLFGQAIIVDVAQGTAVSYKADAIDSFYAEGDFLHTDPGELFPSMASADPTSLIIEAGQPIQSNWNTGEDAISALYMRDSIFNEYVLGSGIDAKTEWVITFLTKSLYVNSDAPRAPFSSQFSGLEGACEMFFLQDLFDRNGQFIDIGFGAVDPPPPPRTFCWNTNVFEFFNFQLDGLGPRTQSEILGSTNLVTLNTNPFFSGWLEMRFPFTSTLTDTQDNYTYRGLPVVGFAVQTYTNLNAQPGLLAQYAALFSHRSTRSIEPVSQTEQEQ